MAREIDVQAALYIHNEQGRLEVEREKRDREFWLAMFGTKGSENGDSELALEESMSKSALGSR